MSATDERGSGAFAAATAVSSLDERGNAFGGRVLKHLVRRHQAGWTSSATPTAVTCWPSPVGRWDGRWVDRTR